MAESTIYRKTAKGQGEMNDRSGNLNMAQRRLLILADGHRSAESIGRFSRVRDYAEMLIDLVATGYLEVAGVQRHPTPVPIRTPPPAQRAEVAQFQRYTPTRSHQGHAQIDQVADIKNYMTSSLRSFAHPARNSRILKEVGAAENMEQLKLLVDPWLEMIAESPGSVQRVEELRLTLIEKFI